MAMFKKAIGWLAPPANKAEDGRDQWPSRTSFILASCGGAVGMGNVLRYPSQVYNNHGLQWFIPYLMAVFLLAIPALMLEIAVGQAYRGGCVVAYNNLSSRMKGTGLSLNFIGFSVVTYFVPILAWVMVYFRSSFQSPLPWTGRSKEFYNNDVIANPDPIPGVIADDGTVESYYSYPASGLLGEVTGWTAFIWFVVWLCMFKGVGLTGRVVYFTMGIPIVTIIILIGRGVSLENAKDGIKLYFATWRGETLSSGQIWQTACGQVFFSTGVGFGYYTSYASYNAKFSNAVQDSFIIVCFNCAFEVFAAFGVFGIVGNLGMTPDPENPLTSFSIGFLTYPEALSQMPGANFWSVLFFFTLMLLGISSSFAMLDAVVTLIMDTQWGPKLNRAYVSTVVVVSVFLLSLMYCTEFGFWLLDGVDTYISNLALVFVVWSECVLSTSVYRYKDIVREVGKISYIIYNVAFFGAMILGVAVAHAVSPPAGAGLAFGLYFAGTILAVVLGKTPNSRAPKFWGGNAFVSRFWYLAFYSGNQLKRDLNLIIGAGKNWNIPVFWAPLLRYVAAPILAIVFSFAYPGFYAKRNDPIYIFGFVIGHVVVILVLAGFLVPKWFDVFVPIHRRGEGHKAYSPNMIMQPLDPDSSDSMEAGLDKTPREKVNGKDSF